MLLPVVPTFPRTSPRFTFWPCWALVPSRWQWRVLHAVSSTECCTTMPFPHIPSAKTRTTVPSAAAITGSPKEASKSTALMRDRADPSPDASPIAVVRENPGGALGRASNKSECCGDKNESPSPGVSARIVPRKLQIVVLARHATAIRPIPAQESSQVRSAALVEHGYSITWSARSTSAGRIPACTQRRGSAALP